jgi:hypothetical protein
LRDGAAFRPAGPKPAAPAARRQRGVLLAGALPAQRRAIATLYALYHRYDMVLRLWPGHAGAIMFPTASGRALREPEGDDSVNAILTGFAMYSGAIENGQMHGPGRLQYANGDVFEVRRGVTLLPALTGSRASDLVSL